MTSRFLAAALAASALPLTFPGLHAQTSTDPKPAAGADGAKTSAASEAKTEARTDADANGYRRQPADWVTRTYYLRYNAQQNDANEILVAARNTLAPWVRVFLVTSQNAIMMTAPPDQQRLMEQIVHDLDRPKQSYKLTYTLTESDAGKRVGSQHYTLLAVTGQRTTSKEGSKVPVLTGSYTAGGSSSAQQQFQYIDVGMNFDATLDAYAGGVRLRSKVEQSSTTEDKSISGIVEPIIRQAVLEGTAILLPGKPVSLGSLDVPGTTRRIDVEVVADLLP